MRAEGQKSFLRLEDSVEDGAIDFGRWYMAVCVRLGT